MNPIGLGLILRSGVAASFGLTWGLLIIPQIVASHITQRSAKAIALQLQPVWVTVALVVAIVFVGVLGPGIRLSR